MVHKRTFLGHTLYINLHSLPICNLILKQTSISNYDGQYQEPLASVVQCKWRFCRSATGCKMIIFPIFVTMYVYSHRVLLNILYIPSCTQPTDTDLNGHKTQGLYSLSGKTSYRQISRSLEAARLGVIMIVSFWNLTGIPAALLPRCLSNYRAIGKV